MLMCVSIASCMIIRCCNNTALNSSDNVFLFSLCLNLFHRVVIHCPTRLRVNNSLANWNYEHEIYWRVKKYRTDTSVCCEQDNNITGELHTDHELLYKINSGICHCSDVVCCRELLAIKFMKVLDVLIWELLTCVCLCLIQQRETALEIARRKDNDELIMLLTNVKV